MWPGRMSAPEIDSVPQVDVQTLAIERDAGRPIFDVRQPDEYEEVRIPQSILVPLATVPDELHQFEGADTVYVVCRSGSRSRKAVQFLRANGVDAVNVAGGTLAWIEAGLPTETGPR
ncbi:MAG: rhodanese-like domain-containing protein [Actinobacteria bacterium]|nr:MAG: rhodanese-like domain-containing protein [Actinomycetota bacterium]